MKNHHFLALGACALSLSLMPTAARADGPATSADKRAEHGKPGEHPGKPGEHPGKPGEHPGKPGEHPGKPGEHPGKPGDEAQSDKGPKGEHGKPGADDDKQGPGAKPGHGPEGFRGGMRQLHEELKAGKLTKDELKDKLAKLHDSAGERGKQHRQDLSKRWGGTLALPSAREELKHHARRMAFLNRALVLAETGTKDKDKLTARITKLIDKENERHERAMDRLKSAPPAAAAAPGASAAPVAAPPAAAASAEGAAK